MRNKLFPFWLPILLTLVLAAIPAALGLAALHYTARFFGDPGQQRNECAVAATLAASVKHDYDTINLRRVRAGLSILPVTFNPVLRGLSDQGSEALLPGLPSRARGWVLIPGTLDCAGAFAARNLVERRWPSTPGNRYLWLYFSRVVLTSGGQVAYAIVGESCGNLCGAGRAMRWRKNGESWILEWSKTAWIA